MTKKKDDEPTTAAPEATVWMRHRDTGAIREVPAGQESALRAEGFLPCEPDGTLRASHTE